MDWVADMFYFIKDWWFLIVAIAGTVYGGYKGIKTINNTLVDIKNELKMSNQRFEASETDRRNIWEKLYKHDERIDNHAIEIKSHEVSIGHLERMNKK